MLYRRMKHVIYIANIQQIFQLIATYVTFVTISWMKIGARICNIRNNNSFQTQPK